MEKTDPGWDNGGANVLIVAIIAVVADLIVRRAAPVQREDETPLLWIMREHLQFVQFASLTLKFIFLKHLRHNPWNLSGGETPEEIVR